MQRLSILFLFLIYSSLPFDVQQESFDAVPDCDADFALHALALIQAKMADLPRLQQVEAILASCNKPMLQKLTEASIRLLHKGVIPSQLQEQLHQLASVRKKAKREKYTKLEQEAPRQYSEVINYIGQISTNDSLSGNEKLLYIQSRLFTLRGEERQELRRLLMDQQLTAVLPQKITSPPAVAVITPPTFFQTAAPSIPIKKEPFVRVPESQVPKLNFSIPPSFAIPSANEVENLLFTSRKVSPERVQLPSRISPSQPSVFIKTVPMGVQELPTRTEPEVRGSLNSLGTPISAQVSTQGKPGTGLEDFDLLKSRNNIWSEAAKFLDQSTNIPQQIRDFIQRHAGLLKGNPQMMAGLTVPANTFPLPAGVYEQLNKAYSGTSERRYLPTRQRDAVLPEIRYRGLDRFDAFLDRFGSKGDPNSRLITTAITDPVRPLSSDNQGRPREEGRVPPPAQGTGGQVEIQGGFVQVPDRAPGFVQFPTYKPAPSAAQETVVLQGHSGTKTVLPGDKYPSFPSIDISNDKLPEDKYPGLPFRNTTLPPPLSTTSLSYISPDEITGSNRYPKEPYNVMSGSQRRFVKVDVLNEH